MKTKHIILIALAGFLILFYICLKGAAPLIENKIRNEANTILQNNGLTDVIVQASGRDVVLTGKVKTKSQLNLLDSLVKHITGVRFLTNQVLLVPEKVIRKKLPKLKLFYQPNASSVTFMHEILLKHITSFLHSDNQLSLQVNGYTDVEGDENYNLHLSEKRAKNVFTYLVENGIPEKQIIMNYFGEAGQPSNVKSLREQAKNRKVEVIISEVN